MAQPTKATNTLASALISGDTPRRTFEKITIGCVVAEGPVTKEEITRSSTDRVKASSQPAIKAGAISGRVITRNTFNGRAPRSIAASSSDMSICARRERTTTVTKDRQKVIWAMTMVVIE